jgi:4-hydroxy-tetrahydrodipicolinate synthase
MEIAPKRADQAMLMSTSRLPAARYTSLTALPTPFMDEGVAEESFAKLVELQIEQGSQGIVVCSVTGEGPVLSPKERHRLIQIAVETSAGRAPVVAATGTNCTQETIVLTRAAQEAGASAALIVTPYYNKPNQAGVYLHCRDVARSVDLPLIIEADPSRSGIDISSQTLGRLAEIPNIVAIEDVMGDLRRIRDRADLIVLSGDDNACVSFRLAGGSGSVSVVANLVPTLWATLQRAVNASDWPRASMIQAALQPLVSALQLEANPAPVKYALSLLHSWFSPQMRLPLVTVNEATGVAVREALARL